MSAIRERAEGVFRRILKQPALVLRDEMTAFDVQGWDSMAHIQLIVALEKEFAVKLSAGEVVRLKTVGQILELLQKKTGSAAHS